MLVIRSKALINADPLWSDVVLLLEGNSPTFTDRSTRARVPLRSNNLTITSSPGSLISGSMTATNTAPHPSSHPSLQYAASSDFRTQGPWALDFRIKVTTPATGSTPDVFFMANNSTRYFGLSAVGGTGPNSSNYNLTAVGWANGSAMLVVDQWHWIRVVSDASNMTTFMCDGVPGGAFLNSTASSDPLQFDVFAVPGRDDLRGLRGALIEQVRFTRATRSITAQPTQTQPWPTL